MDHSCPRCGDTCDCLCDQVEDCIHCDDDGGDGSVFDATD